MSQEWICPKCGDTAWLDHCSVCGAPKPDAPSAAKLCVCGHPASEHRAEVLPFAVCRHLDSRSFTYAGAPWSFAGLASPCPCTAFKEAA